MVYRFDVPELVVIRGWPWPACNTRHRIYSFIQPQSCVSTSNLFYTILKVTLRDLPFGPFFNINLSTNCQNWKYFMAEADNNNEHPEPLHRQTTLKNETPEFVSTAVNSGEGIFIKHTVLFVLYRYTFTPIYCCMFN